MSAPAPDDRMCYVAFCRHGISVAVTAADRKGSAKDVEEFLADGLTVKKMANEEFRASSGPFGCDQCSAEWDAADAAAKQPALELTV